MAKITRDAPPGHAPPARTSTVHSRYVEMLLAQDQIPRTHTILASFFAWLLLAGFVVFPGTFTSLKESYESDSDSSSSASDDDNLLEQALSTENILDSVRNVPLLVVGSVCCGIGVAGMVGLYFAHAGNYVWLLNRLFVQGIGNSLAGIISTLIGVYAMQHGEWSITAKVAASVEGGCFAVCGVLFVVYEKLLVSSLRRKHRRHVKKFGIADGSTV